MSAAPFLLDSFGCCSIDGQSSRPSRPEYTQQTRGKRYDKHYDKQRLLFAPN